MLGILPRPASLEMGMGRDGEGEPPHCSHPAALVMLVLTLGGGEGLWGEQLCRGGGTGCPQGERVQPPGAPWQGLSLSCSKAVASALPSQHPTAPPPPSLINIAGKNKTKQSKYLIRSREPRRALPPSVSSASRSQQLPSPNEPECSRDRWRRQPPQRGQVCHVPLLCCAGAGAQPPVPPQGHQPQPPSSSCPVSPPLCPLRLPGGTRALLRRSRPFSCCYTGHELCRASAGGWGLPRGCRTGRA